MGRERFPSWKVNKREAILHIFAVEVPVPTVPGNFLGRGNLHSISVPSLASEFPQLNETVKLNFNLLFFSAFLHRQQEE